MSGPRKKPGAPSAGDGPGLSLDSLFSGLGAALSEMIDRLEDGAAGEIRRDRAFQTDRGPIHAQAGIRIRFAGASRAVREMAPPGAPHSTPSTDAPAPVARTIAADVFDDGRVWRMTADLPGIAQGDLDLAIEDGHLLISARTARRSFTGRVAIPAATTLSDLRTTLQNGILEIEAPSAGRGGAA